MYIFAACVKSWKKIRPNRPILWRSGALVIISENDSRFFKRYGNTQFRYATIYIIITFVVLLFLNIYSSDRSQELFYRSKKASMIERCLITAADIAEIEVLNTATVTEAVNQMSNLKVTRMLITDHTGQIIYDSTGATGIGSYALLPEILQALKSNNVFSWSYHDSCMVSKAATPIYSYGTLTGCIYIMERDDQQGALMASLQRNILSLTLVLEVAVIIFSVFFSTRFSRRMKRIRTSMRIIRNGDYSHKVNVGGRDELTLLGDEFNDLTEKLNTSEGKRRQFVSDASHELKTPLASIKLLSDSILQNDMDMETVKEFVGDIGNEAERLNRMSSKLLSLSRIESMDDADNEIINIVPTAERVVRMLSSIAQQSQVTIITDFQQDSPVLIPEDDLYQILFNLAENGIKYNVPGGKLTILLNRQEDNAVIAVIDTGVGIPDEAIGHVFERFFRVDKARSRKSGGSGLGLSIVKNMVEKNGGSIQVESVPQRGSSFTVTFPIFDTEADD